ncbi:MAG: sporadically distributed protein, TIGR04141 family, partial [Gammaproteobacteria bacterium]|nr:sporadically distributed protein, TIGR04141 family [Gammaproteobacteria bacterium]
MAPSHYFSIYLLKANCDVALALREEHDLIPNVEADHLPEGASLYLAEDEPRPVWWKKYFGIDRDLRQAFKGALVFVPTSDRVFAFSFGRAYHSLRQGSYEPDFGLRVTLNAVDPNKIKNTDIIEPVNARRQRTQVPVLSDLTLFDFDHDNAVLKNLAGKARDDYTHFVRNVSGQDNLRISSDVQATDLPTLCEQLLS